MAAITATNQTTTLANTVIQRFDSNRNGSLSSDEFATFLTQLVSSLTTPQNPAATATRATDLSTLFPGKTTPPASRSRVGDMAGFDARKLGDETHDSFKYQVGRILQYYPNTVAGLKEALPEIQKLVPGATIIGTHGDRIDFGDFADPESGRIGIIDVLVGAAQGGRAWAWQPVE